MAKPKVETVSLDALVPDPLNARVRDARASGALSKSVEAFGLGRSVVVDSGGVVRAGNGTLDAARAAGVREVVIVETDGTQLVAVKRPDWSEEQAIAYAIADNRTGDLSSFDGESLRRGLLALVETATTSGDAGSLDATGFSERELADIFERGRLPAAAAPKHAAPSALLEVDAPPLPTTPVTRAGDVWALGDHVLVCGDCREAGVVGRAFGGGAWDLLVTDPPYGVSYASKNAFLNSVDKGNRVQAEIENDHASPDEMGSLWLASFKSMRAHGAAGAPYYVTGPQGGDLLLLLLSLRDAGFPLRHMLIWVKNNHVIGRSDYNYKHEPIVYGWLEGAAHPFVSATSDTSVWEIDRPHSSKLHPTMKPVELYARAMRNSSVAGGVVADPFAGSGTAIVAAEQLGRRAVAIEVSPHYCDVIVSRWESLTGKRADRRSAL